MTPSPAPTASRTVGDVLRAQGVITEEQLENALARQRDTGQPLGQILVESGLITRLDLASALAEQWSDAPHLVRLEPGKNGFAGLPSFPETITFDTPLGASAAERAIAELRTHAHAFAARLEAIEVRSFQVDVVQERLGELRQWVKSLADWASGPELRLTELESRMSALQAFEELDPAARLAAVEGHVGSVSERIEQVISAIDQAVTDLEDVTAGLTEKVEGLATRIDGTVTADQLEGVRLLVDELAARPLADPEAAAHSAAELAALGLRLDALELRPEPLAEAGAIEELRSGLDDLRAEVEGLRSPVDLRDLRDLVEQLGARVEGTATAPALDEVRLVLDEVAARPVADPELPVLVAGLTDRLDSSAEEIEQLRAAVGEVSARPAGDPERVEGLVERVGELTARLDGLAVSADGKVDVNVVAELREAIEAIAARPVADLELAARVEALEGATAGAVVADGDVAELRAAIERLSGRIDAAAPVAALDALRAEIVELAGRPAVEPALFERLDALSARIDALAAAGGSGGNLEDPVVAELRAAVAELGARPVRDTALAADVQELRAALAEIAGRPVEEASLSEEIAAVRVELAARAAAEAGAVDELAARVARIEAGHRAADPSGELAARLAELEGRVEAVTLTGLPAASGNGAEAPAGEIDKLRVSVESLWMRMSEFQKSIASLLDPRGVAGKLDRLESRLGALEAGGHGAGVAATTSGDLREIARRIEDMESAASSSRDTLLIRLERMASSIDWRLQRLETTDES